MSISTASGSTEITCNGHTERGNRRHKSQGDMINFTDNKNHGGGITEKESLRRNHCAGNMEEESLRMKNGGGIIEEESWRRNHGG